MLYTSKHQIIEDLDLLTRGEIAEIARAINALPEKQFPLTLKVSATKNEIISQIAKCKLLTTKLLIKVAGDILDQIEDGDSEDDFVNPNSSKKFLMEWLAEEGKESSIRVIEIINKSRKSKLATDGKKGDLLKRLEHIPRKNLWLAIDKMVDEECGDDD